MRWRIGIVNCSTFIFNDQGCCRFGHFIFDWATPRFYLENYFFFWLFPEPFQYKFAPVQQFAEMNIVTIILYLHNITNTSTLLVNISKWFVTYLFSLTFHSEFFRLRCLCLVSKLLLTLEFAVLCAFEVYIYEASRSQTVLYTPIQ